MKTTFSRQFAMIAALLLVCMLITGIGFRFLMLKSVEAEKRRTLETDAAAVANLARAYDSAGELEKNWDFRMSLSFISAVGSAEALVCDLDGKVLMCSCDEFNCAHIGKLLPQSFRSDILSGGKAFTADKLGGIYTEKRFVTGVPIVSNTTGDSIGFVVVSAPMTQISQFMLRSSTLFVCAAVVVLAIALVAATFLSRSQVKPLRQMAEAARSFGRGDLSARAEISKKNSEEINDLAQAFNTMADSLEKSEQRRNEFIANVSHELKTPMTTIGGFIDGMLDGTIPPEKHRQYMQTVSNEVRRLSRLVRNMLDISRLQSQGIDEARKTRFDVSEVMGDALICFEQKINAKHLQVSVDLPDRPVWTRADRDGITQVLYNLIDNAVKFCPDGGQLTLTLHQEGAKALVTVKNTGPTIPPDELPLLFDRFHKADKSRSADREGWGLGLYIAKAIVGAHGEDITVTSENGVTQFCFTLTVVR
jgi:signal transduction histidine kinase